jgi:hypothetical protein
MVRCLRLLSVVEASKARREEMVKDNRQAGVKRKKEFEKK